MTDITVSTEACLTGRTGQFGGGAELAALVLLLLAAPVAIVWHERRAGAPVARILLPVTISLLLGVVLILLGVQVWWYGHDCYT